MAKTNTTVKFDITKLVSSGPVLAPSDKMEIGNLIVEEAKAMIARGQSPVRGYGQFANYKAVNSRIASAKAGKKASAGAKKVLDSQGKGYPFNTPEFRQGKKGARPVNLELSGAMLESYTATAGIGDSVLVGYRGEGEVGVRALAHNSGPTNGRFAQRKTVPGDGEEFAVSIMRSVRDLYEKIIRAMLDKSNR